MRLGIVGLPRAGKTSVFAALTGEPPGADALAGRTITKVVRVFDRRLEKLRDAFRPKSFKPATFEATDFGPGVSKEARMAQERESDALLVVLNAYAPGAKPERDLAEIDTEWVLADLQVAEKRVEKLRAQVKKPIPAKEKEAAEMELQVLERCTAALAAETPLRAIGLGAKESALVKHFNFFTLKPRLLVRNVAESALPYGPPGPKDAPLEVCAKLEAELAEMDPEERVAFLRDFGIEEPARERLIQRAYELLGLRSFFTAGEDEVRAWTIPAGTKAPEAAGAIHTDIQRGFIRAEVLAYADFEASGGMKQAKAAGKVRLEGKDYVVKDADIIEFRFSV
jgi:GTP-binding protein YchF